MQAELAARQELEKLNAELEDRVRQRTSELAQRADQLALINRISRDAISLLDLNALLARAVSTIRETFGYYEVGILLVDQAANTICLRAASTLESGDFLEGQEPLSLNPPDSLIGHAALTGQPLVAGDARQDPRFRYDERLPRTQSELALPLRVGDQIVGVLDLESTALNAFSAQDVQVLQTLADQIAVAIQNARLYEGEAEARRAADILSEEAQLARAEAEKANRAKSEFLASMSHELRTPLNGILGYAQILKRDKGLSPAQMDGLNIIQHSGEHLLTLINDILDLAKIEAGRLELGPTDFNLPNFLQGITGIIRMRAEQKNIVFAYEADTPLPAGVRADERRLRQVLINLLGNAVKFTDAGQVTFKISDLGFNPDRPSYAESDLCTLRFTVKDTGVGIAPELLEKIFSPFEQAGDLRRRAEGTGLGLSISRKLVQAMGSDIRVSSQLGQGSAFEFELQLPVAIHIGNERAIEQTIVGYKGPARTALVVDDKNYNRAVLVNLLAGLGFEIVEAENGRQAVDKARERRPDIILMDLVMPVMTGFEATQQIRKLPGMERVVIIATTASAFDLDKQQSMLAGCDDFIAKPVSVKKLFALLEEHLELEWVYEEPEPPPPEVIVTASDAPPPLPPAEVASLYDLAMKGDVLGLQERAGQIETMGEAFQPFAARLRQLAKNFETEEILALVEQYTEAQP
jgi:signal transduction histidine kinase/ActR/RegA family two-component response regulator